MVRVQSRALARKNFLESMLYLVGLFIAVLVDVNL
jgi:heme O synthase-like polyprenyltransferase